jgi:hypothetical protein
MESIKEIVFQGLDTLHLVYQGSFDFRWWETTDLKEKKLIAQKKRDKPFCFCWKPGSCRDFDDS